MKRSGMPLHINSHRFTSIHISSHHTTSLHTTSDYVDKWEKAEEDEVIDVLEPTRKVKIPEFTEMSLIRHKVNTTGVMNLRSLSQSIPLLHMYIALLNDCRFT